MGWVDAIVVDAMATTPQAGKMDSDVRREEEESYKLRDVADHGMGGWEEGRGCRTSSPSTAVSVAAVGAAAAVSPVFLRQKFGE